MKTPNFMDKKLTFPVNIPIRYTYLYKPSKRPPPVPMNDYLNFKSMTGNEILLYLENPSNLRDSEFSSALNELMKRPGAIGTAYLLDS